MRRQYTPLAVLALVVGLVVGGPVAAGELSAAPDDASPYDWIRTYFEECLNRPGDYACLGDGKIQSGKIISDRMAVAEALGYEVAPPGAAGP